MPWQARALANSAIDSATRAEVPWIALRATAAIVAVALLLGR